jgi:hypothetical protein
VSLDLAVARANKQRRRRQSPNLKQKGRYSKSSNRVRAGTSINFSFPSISSSINTFPLLPLTLAPLASQTFGPNLKRQGADKSKRRRDELREGFRRLKEVLPATTQRSSKSSLLDRCEFSFFLIIFLFLFFFAFLSVYHWNHPFYHTP